MGAGVLSHIYPSLELKNAENLPKFRHHPLAPGGGASDWSSGERHTIRQKADISVFRALGKSAL